MVNRMVKASLLSLAMVGCVNAHEIVIKNLGFKSAAKPDDVTMESVSINGKVQSNAKIMFADPNFAVPSSDFPNKVFLVSLVLDLDGNVSTTTDQFKFDLDVGARKARADDFGTCSISFKPTKTSYYINKGSFWDAKATDPTIGGRGLRFTLSNVVDTAGLPATSAIVSKVGISISDGASLDEIFSVNGVEWPLTEKASWLDASSNVVEVIAEMCNGETLATGVDLTFNVETNPIKGVLRFIAIH